MATEWYDYHWVLDGGEAQKLLEDQGYRLNLTERRKGKTWARMVKRMEGEPPARLPMEMMGAAEYLEVERGELNGSGDGACPSGPEDIEPFPGSCELGEGRCTPTEPGGYGHRQSDGTWLAYGDEPPGV
jgi:hypothetical protein